jgi:hypothetical protein
MVIKQEKNILANFMSSLPIKNQKGKRIDLKFISFYYPGFDFCIRF